MKTNRETILYNLLKGEGGQMLPVMGVLLVVFFATAALSVDLGRAYYCYRELQSSANAAALAGAQSLPATSATTAATAYSSVAGDSNAQSNLPNVSMVTGYPKLECLTSLTNIGMACVAPANANAIQVQEQTVLPMYFARIFGKQTLTLTATATASMRGAASTPYTVAIIIDTTSSMSDTDSDSQCTTSRLACALAGAQVLVQDLYPCIASETTCGTVTNGMVSNSVDRISLFAFPNVTLGTVGKDYDCSSTNPTNEPYTFPAAGSSTYAPSGSSTPTYQIVGYSSDYRTSDTTSTLSSSSDLVKSIGGESGCTGMGNPGGEGTYYAGVIYAAQASLGSRKDGQCRFPERPDHPLRRRRERKVIRDAERLHDFREVPLHRAAMQPGSDSGGGCGDGGNEGVHDRVWRGGIGVLNRYQSSHHSLPNNGEYGLGLTELLLRLHGNWRQQQLHLRLAGNDQPGTRYSPISRAI